MLSNGVINAVLESSSSGKSPSRSQPIETTSPAPTEGLELLEEALRVLMTVVNICLRPSLMQSNMHLVHYLLYSERELRPYMTNPIIVETRWLGNIPAVMSHFDELFNKEDETLSVERAMEILEKGSRILVGKMKAHMAETNTSVESDVKFTYEEEVDSEAFFVPYIWELIYQGTKDELLWVQKDIELFDVGVQAQGEKEDRIRSDSVEEAMSPSRSSAAAYKGFSDKQGEEMKVPQILTMNV